MAATQAGTGGLTVAGQATKAAVFITVPASSIIESVTTNPGGSPQFEDIPDEDGAHHTRITFEKQMTTATIIIVGKAYSKSAGELDGSGTNYYIESVAEEAGKSAYRTTVTVTKMPTI